MDTPVRGWTTFLARPFCSFLPLSVPNILSLNPHKSKWARYLPLSEENWYLFQRFGRAPQWIAHVSQWTSLFPAWLQKALAALKLYDFCGSIWEEDGRNRLQRWIGTCNLSTYQGFNKHIEHILWATSGLGARDRTASTCVEASL